VRVVRNGPATIASSHLVGHPVTVGLAQPGADSQSLSDTGSVAHAGVIRVGRCAGVGNFSAAGWPGQQQA
jgi:hypothetical protein